MLDTTSFTSTATPITGKTLAHMRGNVTSRANTAADLYAGSIVLQNLTMAQAAALARVNTAAVRKTLAQRGVDGRHNRKPRLIASWEKATAQERIDFAQHVGAETLFDSAIVPAL